MLFGSRHFSPKFLSTFSRTSKQTVKVATVKAVDPEPASKRQKVEPAAMEGKNHPQRLSVAPM